MGAFVRRIDLAGFRVEDVALGKRAGAVVVGRRAPAQIVIPDERLGREHCRFVPAGGRWRFEDAGSSGGTWLNGRKTPAKLLAHGDSVWLGGTVLVFHDRPEASNPELEAAVGARPDDAHRVRVWADWLLDHGDPLGEHLVSATPHLAVLDGLGPLLNDGRLEIDWRNGLIRAARLRCINDVSFTSVELLARLVSLRVARWMEELTVDLSTWVMPSTARIGLDTATVLRGLAEGPRLPGLRRLSLGYVVEPMPDSSFIDELLTRVRARSPALETTRSELLPVARQAWLEVEAVPPGLDFHHPGSAERIPLDAGVWVGSSAQGTLRAVPPGVHRQGIPESFVVRQESPVWCLLPLEPGLRLNGHEAVPTRLLPGDRIEDPRGVRFRFELGR